MKNLLCALVLGFLALQSIAQEKTQFGLTAGYMNLSVKASFEGMNASVSESGFYVGALADIPLSGNLYLQPAVIYGNAEESGILFIPVLAKYYIAESGFSLKAGPQASIILDELDGSTNRTGLDLALGAGYDINDNFFLETKYAFELTNRIKDMEGIPDGVKSTINSFTIGVGYKF